MQLFLSLFKTIIPELIPSHLFEVNPERLVEVRLDHLSEGVGHVGAGGPVLLGPSHQHRGHRAGRVHHPEPVGGQGIVGGGGGAPQGVLEQPQPGQALSTSL